MWLKTITSTSKEANNLFFTYPFIVVKLRIKIVSILKIVKTILKKSVFKIKCVFVYGKLQKN
ncbi:MAG: hypothetical protein EAZ55_11840 [Cytophagales bacterium]|nr:MAG: hypothetical protein EAZ55_11840 [Cytophagales bacterium]